MSTPSITASTRRPTVINDLHGWRLFAARALCGVAYFAAWSTFIIAAFGHKNMFIIGAPIGPAPVSPSVRMVETPYVLLLDGLVLLVASAVGGLVIRQRGKNWFGLYVAGVLVMFGAAGSLPVQQFALKVGFGSGVARAVITGGILGSLSLVFLFPSGHFTPRWTRPFALLSIPILIGLSFMIDFGNPDSTAATIFAVAVGVILFVGMYAQYQRRKHASAPIEIQQTKWAVVGVTLSFLVYALSLVIGLSLSYSMADVSLPALQFGVFLTETLQSLTFAILPVTIGISIVHYQLWSIDPLVNRVLVYGTVTLGLGALLVVVVVVFQYAFKWFFGETSDVVVVFSTLIIVSLYQPIRTRMQAMVDRRFYREKVDVQQAFNQFSRQIRTMFDLPELLHFLAERVTHLLQITYGAVFFKQPDGTFTLRERHRIDDLCSIEEQASLEKIIPLDRLYLSTDTLLRLRDGSPIVRPKDVPFNILIPLTAIRGTQTELTGVLALGPRRSGQSYSREDQNLLSSLADQAGAAIQTAHIITEKQSEMRRRMEAEQALDAYRRSPQGRAESFAPSLVAAPENALPALYGLTVRATEDRESALLLESLPNALKALTDPNAAPLARLAQGYDYLLKSEANPELLPLALRTLTTEVSTAPVSGWQAAEDAAFMYGLCQRLLSLRSVADISQNLLKMYEEMPEMGGRPVSLDDQPLHDEKVRSESPYQPPDFLENLAVPLLEIRVIAETLYASERVDEAADKLGYLVAAAERLSRLDRRARELPIADRVPIQRLSESWLGITTRAMSSLQTSAQINCRLLTRHTWREDLVTLVLSVNNTGRGTATNIRITLAESPDYSAVDGAAKIERLVPGEEAQVEIRVKPHVEPGVGQFRVRATVTFDDPRGPDQSEIHADVVNLLKAATEFNFIPNPYVVGTPLNSGSPLFFGREDVVKMISENLDAAHRNNLVLIGQRRTGKTSLLKQLPARLGQNYLPVYLDGQALGLDPGLAGFFLNLATEITFAVEDRGLTPPEIPDFNGNPATNFERVFLPALKAVIGDRHMLILFDEFEELESAVRRGMIDASIFGWLRHLIQHTDWISIIFCGTHRMEELASDYWNVLFNLSLYRDIGLLSQEEAFRLVQDPVEKYGMRYDDLALDKVWRVTAGHPYFLQLLAHSMVNRHNKTRRNYITVADVNGSLDEIIASGEAHFVYLWNESTPEERLSLTALSRLMVLGGSATAVQVVDYLAERGITADRRAIGEAMRRLTRRNILTAGDGENNAVDVFRWRLGLIGLWVEKYKSLNRVADEVRA